MKNIRIFYSKKGRLKFVSHLDMTRFMTRLLYKSGLPVWFTEGFNPHPYITFALPLSLGFESEYEIMDIRVNDDELPLDDIKNSISAVCPEYIEIKRVAEPVLKSGKVAFAEFDIEFEKLDSSLILEFFSKESVICEKTTKKGKIKEIDIIPKIIDFKTKSNKLTLILPAGSEDNLNPTVVIEAYFSNMNIAPCDYSIIRTKILDSNMKLFV